MKETPNPYEVSSCQETNGLYRVIQLLRRKLNDPGAAGVTREKAV